MRLNELENRLRQIGVEDASSEARVIIEHFFGVSPAKMRLYPDADYDTSKIEPALAKRKEHIPIQYIIGKWYFMGLEFLVNENCLIPRPDTEILVYEALKIIKKGDRVADFCTGSGCIGLSILSQRQDVSDMLLVDISSSALEVARENAQRLNLLQRCTLVNADVTNYVPNAELDVIASNPPYILSEDIEDLSDEVKKEPKLALDGGKDGLDIIKKLIKNSPAFLRKNGSLLIEFGFDQGDKIRKIMEKAVENGEYSEYKIVKDFGGNDRVLVARK